MLTHRAAFPILAVACGVFLAASLVIGRIQYFAVAATAPLIAGNTELEPGGIHWLPVLPLGRKVALAIMDMKLADAVLYPWHRNRVWAPPRIIIEPDFDVSQISTSESDPTLQWTMVVSVAPKEGKPWSERIFPYKGGPVIVWGAAPIVDGSPYPPTFQPKRPGQAVSIDDFAVLPGDVLEIEIRGPTKSFSTSHVVVSPENASSAVQVVYVPK
jgi:hypothetical protein